MPETLNLNYSRYRLHRYSVNFVVVTLFYQTAIDQVYFYEINLRNLLYIILSLIKNFLNKKGASHRTPPKNNFYSSFNCLLILAK